MHTRKNNRKTCEPGKHFQTPYRPALVIARDEIRARANITDIARSLGLRSHGRAWYCPFHEDKTPSAGIKNNRFHCFTCDRTWDVFGLVIELQGVSFRDALHYLAGIYSVPLGRPWTAAERREWDRINRTAEDEAERFAIWLELLLYTLRETRNRYWDCRIAALRWADRHIPTLEDPREWRWNAVFDALALGAKGDLLNAALNDILRTPVKTLIRLWRQRRVHA